MNLLKRFLTLAAALMIALTSLPAAQAETSATRWRWGLTADSAGILALLKAMEVELNEEERMSVAIMASILNAMELEAEAAGDGTALRLALRMSDQEVAYAALSTDADNVYVTTSLLPELAITLPVGEAAAKGEAFLQFDWASLSSQLMQPAVMWAASLEHVRREGVFYGDTVREAEAIELYHIDDRDLAVLVHGWLNILTRDANVGKLIDEVWGSAGYDALMALSEYNHQVAMANPFVYDLRLWLDPQDQPLGVSVKGALRGGAETGSLSVGWENDALHALGAIANGGEKVWLKVDTSSKERVRQHQATLVVSAIDERYDDALAREADRIWWNCTVQPIVHGESHLATLSVLADGTVLKLQSVGTQITDEQEAIHGMSTVTFGEDTALMAFSSLQETVAARASEDVAALKQIDAAQLAASLEAAKSVEESWEKGKTRLLAMLFKTLPSECVRLVMDQLLQ